MKTRHLIYSIALLILALMVWMSMETFTQPGVGDLKGDFVEVAKYRNENNTGPVRRIYAVAVDQEIWHEMKQYGDLMPHTKYGTTKVFFFDKVDNTPRKLRLDPPHFDPVFREFCLGRYEKSAMGKVNFKKYPFKDMPEKALVGKGEQGSTIKSNDYKEL